MKKLIVITALSLLGFSFVTNAQDTTVKHVGHAIKKGAKKVGNKTAEVASKTKAKVTDEVYKDKVGPGSETIYIDNHSKYYWVDKKGHRHYVTKEQLKDKAK